MTLKILPKWMFQLFIIAVSFLLLGLMFMWALQDAGLYALIRHQLAFLDRYKLEQTLLTLFLTFWVIYFPWLGFTLILRRFTDFPSAEFSHDERPNLEQFQNDPRLAGMIAITIGFIFAIVDIVVWIITGDGWLRLWLVPPIAFGLGIYTIFISRKAE